MTHTFPDFLHLISISVGSALKYLNALPQTVSAKNYLKFWPIRKLHYFEATFFRGIDLPSGAISEIAAPAPPKLPPPLDCPKYRVELF